MSQRFDDIVKREKQLYAPTARRWPLALVRGEGSRVWDADGTEYIDLTAGWGVTAIGHCHPELVHAITDQAQTLLQTTNIVFTEPQLELAAHLDRLLPDPIHKSFFVSSGAEANEGALKLAAAATGRSSFVATEGSFHGRTLGAMGVLGQEKHRARWSGIIREAKFVPYGDAAAARRAVTGEIAAMIVEPIQGEGGVVPPPDSYLAELLEICHDAGALLIVDEIQTGIGRTGRWFAFERAGIVPDIVTLGKGLGGGMPIAGFVATDAVMDTMAPGDHGGTYAGNLVTCRAAQTVLHVIERDGLVQRCDRLGTGVRARLDAIAGRLPQRIERARGLGLLQGLVFRDGPDATDVHARAREAGVLTSLTAERVIRLFPALNIPEPELDRGLDLLESVIDG
jgi:acetylornithine/N-succinyldiaminopimelate aminotransferase